MRCLIAILVGFIVPASMLYIRSSPTAGVSTMLFPLCAGTILQLLLFRSMEKRERQNMLLPVSIRRIAIARVSLILLPCVFFYGLYLVLHLTLANTSDIWRHDIYDLFMFPGLVRFYFSHRKLTADRSTFQLLSAFIGVNPWLKSSVLPLSFSGRQYVRIRPN